MPQLLIPRILTAATLAMVISGAAYAVPPESCRRVQFSKERPGWTNSGAWTEKGDLLIADSLRKKILRYSRDGRELGSLPGALAEVNNLSPQILGSSGGKLITESRGGDLIVLDRGYASMTRVDIHSKSLPADPKSARIGALSQWEFIGNDILAFSTLAGPKESDYSLGVISFPIDRPETFKNFLPLKYDESLSTFYRLGHHYLTSLDGIGYIVLMDSKISVRRAVDDRLEYVGTLPSQIDFSPQLPSFESPDDLPLIMKMVEASTMPTGLYGWEHSLYLLWRKPEGAKTLWFLTRIYPNKQPRTVSIKTSANHLTVVPGPNAWAFVEKGRVRSWGEQNIDSILLVPAERIRSAFRDDDIADFCR
jgi:hypothetical protein